MNIIIWLVVGGLVGWIASKVMNTDAQQGIIERRRGHSRRITRRMVVEPARWRIHDQSGQLQHRRVAGLARWRHRAARDSEARGRKAGSLSAAALFARRV